MSKGEGLMNAKRAGILALAGALAAGATLTDALATAFVAATSVYDTGASHVAQSVGENVIGLEIATIPAEISPLLVNLFGGSETLSFLVVAAATFSASYLVMSGYYSIKGRLE